MVNNFTLYTDIPAAGNDPSDDQPLMLTNNQSLSAWANIDHIGFNTNGGGIHKKVTFVNQGVTPTVGDGNSVEFSQISTYNSVSDSWPRWVNTTFPTGLPMFGPANVGNPGYIILTAGVKIAFGNQLVSDGTVITFPAGGFAPIVSVCVTSNIPGNATNTALVVNADQVNNTSFRVRFSLVGNAVVGWIAIGVSN